MTLEPLPRPQESSLYAFCSKWAKRLRLVGKQDSKTPPPKGNLGPYIRFFLAPYRGSIFKALFLLTVAAMTVLSFGFGLRFVVDAASRHTADFLNKGLGFFLIASAVLAVNAYLRITTTSWLGERVVNDIRRQLFAHLMTLDQRFFETTRTGDLIARINTDTSVLLTLFTSSAAVAVRSLLQLFGGLFMMCVTSMRLTGIVLLVIPVILSPIWLLGRRVKSLTRLVQDAQGSSEAYAAEYLGAMSAVQIFGKQTACLKDFADLLAGKMTLVKNRIHMRSGLVCVVIFFAFSCVSTVLWIGSHAVIAGTLSAGALTSFVFFAIITAGSLNSLSEVYGEIQTAAGAMHRIIEIFEEKPRLIIPATPRALTPFQGTLTFENVTFSYPTRPDTPALQGVSFQIKRGERVALVGPSGAGKSTIFQLLLRLYDPTQGRILVDGVPFTDLLPEEVRGHFAVVPQEAAVFNTSAEKNIAFGAWGVPNHQDIEEAAKLAHAHGFITSLPQRYETTLGERGVRLSGGQRQRIALARAFLRGSDILLLDEATNALDTESEAHIQEALETLLEGKTSLIIAHRLSTIEKADRILVIDEGRLVEEGTHAQLLAKGGVYARLAKRDFKKEDRL
ncbi:MAG: ABC transporter [Candidatus Puniceispirillum sp.]|nr:ABC transporter [Candidatus Puniceispirillum sp.]